MASIDNAIISPDTPSARQAKVDAVITKINDRDILTEDELLAWRSYNAERLSNIAEKQCKHWRVIGSEEKIVTFLDVAIGSSGLNYPAMVMYRVGNGGAPRVMALDVFLKAYEPVRKVEVWQRVG